MDAKKASEKLFEIEVKMQGLMSEAKAIKKHLDGLLGPVTTQDWVDANAKELEAQIKCHLKNATDASPRDRDTATRLIMISIRNWMDR